MSPIALRGSRPTPATSRLPPLVGAGIARRSRPTRGAPQLRRDGRATREIDLPSFKHGPVGDVRCIPAGKGGAIFIFTDPTFAAPWPLPPAGGAPRSSDFRVTLRRNNADLLPAESCGAPVRGRAYLETFPTPPPLSQRTGALSWELVTSPRLWHRPAGAPIRQASSRTGAHTQPPRENSNPRRNPARLSFFRQ